MLKLSRYLLVAGWLSLLLACGESDQRSYVAENLIFERLLMTPSAAEKLAPEQLPAELRQRVGETLGAICRGDATQASALFESAGAQLGGRVYRLALIAAKANRKGSCDYANWPEMQSLMGERFKQLVGSGDAASVLLGALLDEQIADVDRQAVIDALAARGYGHAQVFQARHWLKTGQTAQAQELLNKAATQGAMPAHLLLARLAREGSLGKPDAAAACGHLRAAAKAGSQLAPRELAGCPAA